MTFRDDLQPQSPLPPQLQLAITTVLPQPWEEPLKPSEALKKGTIFPSLYLPFYIGGDAHV